MRGHKRHNLLTRRKGAVALFAGLLATAGLVLAGPAFATATITAATGGTGISMDTTSASGGTGAWTSLTGPIVHEAADGDIHTGTVTLTSPSGFEFNTGATVTVAIGSGHSSATKVKATACGTGSQSASATVAATTISINVCQASSGGKKNTMTWSGIKVRPTASSGTPSGTIYSSGATITGVTHGTTSFGTLSTVAGALHHLVLSPNPATITAGGSQGYTVTGQDQFNNTQTVPAGTTYAITPNGSCTGASCTATVPGSHTVTGTNGTATGTAGLSVQVAAAANVNVVLAPSSLTADGSSTSAATVTVTDSFGNPRTADTVTVSTDGDAGVSSVTNNGDGTYSATITASTTAGTETITGTDGAVTGTATLTETGSVTASSVSPSSLGQGADGGVWHQTVVINGANFVNGAVPDFGPDITVSFTTFVDSTQLKAHVIVGGSAATGSRNVAVTNPDTGVAVCAGCFTVNAGPTVSSVTPSVRGAAWAGTVTVTGTNFLPGVKVNFGPSVGVTSLTRIDSQTLTVGLSIAGAAVPGARNVRATNLDAGSGTCSGCFTVTARPTVDAASPSSAPRGSSALAVTITGANFVAGATVSINNGGVTITDVTVVDANTITLKVTIASAAVTGLRTFTVTNSDGGKGSKATFTVT